MVGWRIARIISECDADLSDLIVQAGWSRSSAGTRDDMAYPARIGAGTLASFIRSCMKNNQPRDFALSAAYNLRLKAIIATCGKVHGPLHTGCRIGVFPKNMWVNAYRSVYKALSLRHVPTSASKATLSIST